MTKMTDFFTFAFCFVFFSFLAVHFAHMKTPATERSIASQHETIKPWYDSSWKL